MNPDLNRIWEHMRDLGLGALAHANRHAAYWGIENSKWPELSVLQAAHSAELLIGEHAEFGKNSTLGTKSLEILNPPRPSGKGLGVT